MLNDFKTHNYRESKKMPKHLNPKKKHLLTNKQGKSLKSSTIMHHINRDKTPIMYFKNIIL